MEPHAHAHTHDSDILTSINRAFKIGIVLNVGFVVVEVIMGFLTNSMSLLSDAGHNFSDVISLLLALMAFKLSKIKPTKTFTYGYKKSTILVALANALLLIFAMGIITWDAAIRLNQEIEIPGQTVAMVAFIGIIINSVTAYLFFKSRDSDINVKGAYLHLAIDAAVSLAVVIGGVVMFFTHYFWIDSVLSFIVVIVIFVSTWNLLKESIRMSLDAVPSNVNIEKIKSIAEEAQGVLAITHLHIWALSTTENALTAHLQLNDYMNADSIIQNLKHQWKHENVHHATIEISIHDQSKS